MNLLPGFIRQHRLTHFYNTAENPDKGRLYHHLASRFTQIFGPKWTSKSIDEKWFYFVKNVV